MGQASFAFIAFALLISSAGSGMQLPATGSVEITKPVYDEIIVGDTVQLSYIYSGSAQYARCSIFIDGAKYATQTAWNGVDQRYSTRLAKDRLYWAWVECRPQGSNTTISSYQTRFWLYTEYPYVDVKLVSPPNGYVSSSQKVTLTYDVKSNSIGSFTRCTLYADWWPKDVQAFPPTGGTGRYTAAYTNGLHGWYVRCYEEYGTWKLSELRNFNVQAGKVR